MPRLPFRGLVFFLAALLFAGCSSHAPILTAVPAVKGISGAVHGGQQPIQGAVIQGYAVGTSGDGSAATPLFTAPVVTDANGFFTITGLYTCPSPSALVYITATGGSPAVGVTNTGIALMSALGPCGSPSPSTFININEVTTVAAVYALAPFMSSYSSVGSGSADAAALASAFAQAGYFANVATGTSPGTNVPANYTVPVAQVNTLADLMAVCVNSAGNGSTCGSFYDLTRPAGGTAATDTILAMLDLANNPTLNTTALYDLIPALAPFQPIQPAPPSDFSLHLVPDTTFFASPDSVTFSSAVVNFTQPSRTVNLVNGTAAAINITSILISGANAGDFSIASPSSTDCGSTVPANASCTIGVIFTPSAQGTRSASLVVGNSSANPSLSVVLSGSGTAGTAGPVTLVSSSLAFTQFNAAQPLTLTNSGTTPLAINSIRISSTFYTQTNNCGSSLASSSSCTINVSATGYATGSTATLTVYDDAASGPQTASLSFSGLGSVNYPSSVDFGHWAIGAIGTEFLEITGSGISGSFSFTLTGTNATDFSFSQSSSVLSTTCNYNYRAGSPCYLTLYYKPNALITSQASIQIAGVGQIPVSGTADPAGMDFDLYQAPYQGDQSTTTTAPITAFQLGTSPLGAPISSTFTIQNTGTITPLTLNAPVITGTNASEFSVTAPACASGCTPSVTFTPAGSGMRTATLTYTDTVNSITRTLSLTGTGTIPAPVLTAPTNLFFSNVPANTTSAPQTITVTAYQNHPIQAVLSSTYSGGPQPFVFVGPSSCASTPCTLSIAYAPTATMGDGANVYITATDTVGLTSGNIQAYGQIAPLPYINFTPSSLTFAAQALNSVSAPQTVTFTNTGTTVLTLTFSVPPRNSHVAPDYTLVNHCPASLAINASCTVDVSFAPVSTTGTLDTNLEIYGSNVTRYVSLSGVSF